MDQWKWIYFLLLCQSSVFARSGWTPGREYIYRWNAVTGSGIPGVGPEASGIYLSAQLRIQARDQTNVLVKLSGLTARAIQGEVFSWNEVLESPSAKWSEIPLAGRSLVETPFQIRFRDGQVETLNVAPNEPLWSINLKKAIASNLQVPTANVRGSVSPLTEADSFEGEGEAWNPPGDGSRIPHAAPLDSLRSGDSATLGSATRQESGRLYSQLSDVDSRPMTGRFGSESIRGARAPYISPLSSRDEMMRGKTNDYVAGGFQNPAVSGQRGYRTEDSISSQGGHRMEDSVSGQRGYRTEDSVSGQGGYRMEDSVSGQRGYRMEDSVSGQERYRMEDSVSGQRGYRTEERPYTGSRVSDVNTGFPDSARFQEEGRLQGRTVGAGPEATNSAVFTVMEDSVTGTCETSYQISPLSADVHGVDEDLPVHSNPEGCATGSYFQIVKSVDFNMCRSSPVFNVVSPPGWKCKPGAAACHTSRQRSSIGRYVACGSLSSFTVISMVHHGALINNPYSIDTERLEAHTLQKLRLQTTRPFTDTFSNIGSTVPVRSLNFAFAPETPGSTRLAAPHSHDVDRSLRTLTFAQIRSQISSLMEDTVNDIRTAEDLAARSAIDRIAAVSEALSLLDYTELGQLVSEVMGITIPRSEASRMYPSAYNASEMPYSRGQEPRGRRLPEEYGQAEDYYQERRQQGEHARRPYERPLTQAADVEGRQPLDDAWRVAGGRRGSGQVPVNPALPVNPFSENLDPYARGGSIRGGFGGEAGGQATSERSELFFDALVAAGSNPSISLMIDLVTSGRISTTRAVQAVSALPLIVRTPTRDVLQKLVAMVRSETTSGDRDLYYTSLLSTSTLLRMACVNQTEARTRFPVTLYGPFCTPTDPLIVSQFVPLLSEALRRTSTRMDKIVSLTALGNLGHPSIMPILIPVIEGQVDSSINVRTKAVIALHKLAIAQNLRAHQILLSVYQNPSEHYQVRIAAFTLLILANPPVHRWQEFAISTWFEHDMQVSSYVYTTLKSLAAMKDPIPSMVDRSEKAYAVLSIARPIPWNFHYSRNIILSGRIHENRLGATLFTEIFGSQETVLPNQVYSRLNWCLGALNIDSVEFELYGLQLPKIWERVSSMFSGATGATGRAPGANRDTMRDVLHEQRGGARLNLEPLYEELRRMRQHYEASTAPSEDTTEGFLHVVLMESIARFYPLDGKSIETMLRGFLSARGGLTSGTPISVLKWMPLLEFETILPDPLGFAVTLRSKAHALISLQGAITSNVGPQPEMYAVPQWGADVSGVNLDLDVKPTIIAKIVSKVSINAGFTMVRSASGVDTHAMVSLPGRFSVRADMQRMRFGIGWTNTPSRDNMDKTLFHFHVRPFTGMQSVHDLTPVTSVQISTEILGLGENLHENLNERAFSGLGFNYRVIDRSETPFSLDNIWNFMEPQFNFITASSLMWMPSSVKRKLVKVVQVGTQQTTQAFLFVNFTTPYSMYGPRGEVNQPTSRPAFVAQSVPHAVPPGNAVFPGQHPIPRPGLPVHPTNAPPAVAPATIAPSAQSPTVAPVVQPIVSPDEYNQRNFAGYMDTNATSGVNMELYIVGNESAVFRFNIGRSSSSNGERQAFHLSIKKEGSSSTAVPLELCINAESRLPLMQFRRTSNLSPNYESTEGIHFNATVGFGRTCSSYGFKVDGNAMQSPELKSMIRGALANQRCDAETESGSWQRWNERRYGQENMDLTPDVSGQQPYRDMPELNPVPRSDSRTSSQMYERQGDRTGYRSNFPEELEREHIRNRPRPVFEPRRPETQFYPASGFDTQRSHRPEEYMNRQPGDWEATYQRRPYRNPEYEGPFSKSYGGVPNACRTAREWSNILDTYNVTMDLSTLPHFAINATYMFGQYYNRYWLPYYAHSHGVPGRVHVIVKTHPLVPSEYGTADVMMYTPGSNVSFASGKLPAWMGLLLPVTKTPSISGALFGDSFSPVCVMRDNAVTTFDGVTYEGELTDCNHVLISSTAGGAGGEEHFAVLARRRGAKKVFTLIFGSNEIFIGPISAKGPGVLRVNGVDINFGTNNTLQIPLTAEGGAVARGVAVAEQLNDGALRFTVPSLSFEMVTDGNVAQIRVSPLLRGQVAGMCGNMDSQPGTSELRGPDGCRVSSGNLFTAAYAMNDGKCTGVADQVKAELKREQANCQRGEYSPSRVSHFSRRLRSQEPSGSCTVLRTLTLYRGDRKCFSTQPVVDCKPGCEPRSQVSKSLGFHCMSGRLANRLEEEALTRPLAEMSGREETFRTSLNIPTSCVAVSAF